MPKLPWYVKRAIKSTLAHTAPFSSLSYEQWLEIAKHVHKDEKPESEGGTGFLRKGASYRGTKPYWVLRGILYEAVESHAGVLGQVPHGLEAEQVYQKLIEPEVRAERREQVERVLSNATSRRPSSPEDQKVLELLKTYRQLPDPLAPPSGDPFLISFSNSEALR